VIKLDQEGNTDELDIFSRAAGDLISGKKLSDLGTPVTKINEKFPLRATIDKDKIIGSILFIDSYGNAISNITRDLFYRVFENKEYRILIRRNSNFTEKISQKYSDVPVNEILAKFNQLDLLEMALNGVDISDTFTISIGDAVRVESKNKPVLPDQLF
jgi:S-adenosylmethionine hydrolase